MPRVHQCEALTDKGQRAGRNLGFPISAQPLPTQGLCQGGSPPPHFLGGLTWHDMTDLSPTGLWGVTSSRFLLISLHKYAYKCLYMCPHVCLCTLESHLTSPYWKTVKNLFWLCHCLCSAKQTKKLGRMKYCFLKWNKISSCKSTLWECAVCPSFC